jgi:hydrogenase maturation protein HypF
MLDAASALLDICYTRTYEGEPAMKLESSAIGGTDLKIPVEIEWKQRILKTTPLFSELFKRRTEHTRDLAYSAEHYIAAGLAEIAVAHAEKKGIETVVLAGGCTYNAHITHTIRTVVEHHGLKLLKNSAVPPGDGGISFGQAVAAGWV